MSQRLQTSPPAQTGLFPGSCPVCASSNPIRPTLEVIAENIRAIDYPNTEIIVSDRHGLVDTIDKIEHQFRDNPRLRFLRSTDELDWVQHYKLLLNSARGECFLWMAHDDSYSHNYISELVSALEADPGTVLAFLDAVSYPNALGITLGALPRAAQKGRSG